MRRTLTVVAIIAFCWTAPVDFLSAQTPEDVEAAKREKDYEEAKAAARKARLGELPTEKLPGGTGSAESLAVEGHILAYRAVDLAACEIAARVVGVVYSTAQTPVTASTPPASTPPAPTIASTEKSLVIFREPELLAIQQHRMFRRQTQEIQVILKTLAGGHLDDPKVPLESDKEPNACSRPPPSPSQPVRPEGLGALTGIAVGLQVLSLFKNDKTVIGTAVTSDEFALASAVIARLKSLKPDLKVAYPASYFPNAFAVDVDTDRTSEILKEPTTLSVALILIDFLQRQAEQKKKKITDSMGSSRITADCKELYKGDLARLERFEVRAKALQTVVLQSQAVLLKVDEKTGTSGLQTLYSAETLAKKHPSAHILQLKLVAVGGATLAKKNLFTTNFFFSGGAVVSYMLLDGTSGEVTLASVVPRYAGFTPAEDLIKLVDNERPADAQCSKLPTNPSQISPVNAVPKR